MTQRKRQSPVWPKIVGALCLFLLGLIAPHSWKGNPQTLSGGADPSDTHPTLAVQQAEPGEDLSDRLNDDAIARSIIDGLISTPAQPLQIELVPGMPFTPPKPAPPAAEETTVIVVEEIVYPPVLTDPRSRDKAAELFGRLRDTVAAFVDQAAEFKEQAHQQPAPQPAPVAVKVTSPNDRLAMRGPLTFSENNPLRHGASGEDQRPAETVRGPSVPPSVQPAAEPAQDPAPAYRVAVIPEPKTTTVASAPPREKPEPRKQKTAPRPRPGLLPEEPKALLDRLRETNAIQDSTVWSSNVIKVLYNLTSTPADIAPPAGPTLDRLEQLAAEGRRAALANPDPDVQQCWLQAAGALERRLGFWRMLLDPHAPDVVGDRSDTSSNQGSQRVQEAVTRLSKRLADSEAGRQWHQYLLLDELAAWTSPGLADSQTERRDIATEVLYRLHLPEMTDAQRRFVDGEPFQELRSSLHPWLAGPVSLRTLAILIERYESGAPVGARGLELAWERLACSTDPDARHVAELIQQHYRGANMRVAISAEMLNRLLPPVQPTVTPVHGEVAGVPVEGRAQTSTELRVDLKPDDSAWRIGLQAVGQVQSQTRSENWPALVRNHNRTVYQAEKLITVSPEGVYFEPATASASGRNRLVGVHTRFDGIPLIETLARDAVRDGHRKRNGRAIAEVKAKVARQARLRLDSEATPKLESLEERFADRVLGPLTGLSLVAQPVQLATTEDRAVMRLLMASDLQLAANTTRPAAPDDSLASLQIHESAFNNAAKGLDLAGRTLTAPELFDTLVTRLHRTGAQQPDDLPQRAKITFPNHDPIVIHCDDDRVVLTLAIKEMGKGRDKIRDFTVHAYFKPIVEGLQVKLVRDGTLQFSGRRVTAGARIVLHSVFGKLIRKDHEVPVLTAALHEDPRLAGLMVTQLVIDDGWVALALGPSYPERTAWRTRNTLR